VLFFQHPVLVLVFKQKLCLSLARLLGSLTSFSSVFQWHLFSQLLCQWRVACPQVPEISSVAYQLSCFGVCFSLCWFIWGLFLCFAPFLWGKVSDPSAGPLLSVCCDDLLIVFQFCSVIWLCLLLTGSGDELCGLLPALFQAVAYHLPVVGLLPFQHLFTENSCRDLLLALLAFSSALTAPRPLRCVLVFSSLFILLFCFVLQGRGGQSAQGAMLVYPRGGWGDMMWHLVLTC
jgi:hypothetical protein